MAGKYDSFWQERLSTIKELCDQARENGVSESLDISAIESLGDRETWHGFALVKGGKIRGSSMAHIKALAEAVVRAKALAKDPNYYRFACSNTFRLVVYRMNWKSHEISGRLPYEEVALLEEILPAACRHLAQVGGDSFLDSALGKWIEANYSHVKTFTDSAGKGALKTRYPDKQILNIRNACYHLWGADSFWIESLHSGKRVEPFRKVANTVYSVKPNWVNHLPGHQEDRRVTKKPVVPLIETVMVSPPPRSQESDPKVGAPLATKGNHLRDYAEEAREHQVLGLAGEKYVLKIERDKLVSAGRDDLVEKVVHVSVDEGDVAGYDIRSFDRNGEEIFIEVKTTTEGIETPFFVSANQLNVSIRYPEKYILYRVFDYDVSKHSGSVYEAKGRLDKNFHLSPQEYRAKR